MKAFGALPALAVLLLASQAVGGWVIQEVSGGPGEEQATVVYMQDNRLKSVDSEITIIDLNEGTFTMIAPGQSAFARASFEEFQGLAAEGPKQLEEYLEQLPEAQREAYREMMGNFGKSATEPAAKPRVEVKQTSERATVAGHSTRKYQVRVNGNLKEEIWIADGIDVSREIDLDRLQDLLGPMQEMGGEVSFEASEEYKSLLKKGLPLRTIDYDGPIEHVTEVRSVEERNIPDSEFLVPAGYREVALRDIWQLTETMDDAYDPYTDYGYGEIEED